MAHILDRIEDGGASAKDVDLLFTVARQMQNKCLCALGEFSTMPVVSSLEKFRSDFLVRVDGQTR